MTIDRVDYFNVNEHDLSGDYAYTAVATATTPVDITY